MLLPDFLRNSKILRWPLLSASRLLLLPLKAGPAILRRAVYDAMPVRYFVTGSPEQFVVSTADKVIGRELFLHGEFDFSKLQAALAIVAREGLPPPDHLIDVGANIGTIVIPALARGLLQTATAIEPHPSNLRLLHANLALNNLSHQVKVFGVAVGDESGITLRLKESATNSGNHSIDRDGIPVPSVRLDDLDIPERHALLWIDIEGYEGHALKGASIWLSTGIPVVCEYNTAYLMRSGGMKLFRQALKGRRIFDLKGEVPLETTFDELSTRYPKGHDFTDILAIPVSAGGQ